MTQEEHATLRCTWGIEASRPGDRARVTASPGHTSSPLHQMHTVGP